MVFVLRGGADGNGGVGKRGGVLMVEWLVLVVPLLEVVLVFDPVK